jgi:hypothetical protein
MNNIEYYIRQKDNWDSLEIEQLKTEYQNNELTISEIADIHYRTPGSISYKLKALKIISDNKQSRGYNDYKNSNLYKSIVNSNINTRKDKSTDKKVSNNNPIQEYKLINNLDNRSTIRQKRKDLVLNYESDIAEIKKDIKALQKSVSELTDMLKAIYEFEETDE